MTSNSMHACLNCRVGNKSGGKCTLCGEQMICFGKHITLPKKNDKRAWRRIAKGEKRWNRRKSRYGWFGMRSYDKENLIPAPNQTKGGRRFMLDHSGSSGPDVDLGG